MNTAATFVVAMSAAGAAFAGTIATDFSGFANGDNVAENTTFNAGTAAEFVATSAGNNQGMYIFDTTPGGPNDGGPDQDLIVPGFGNAMILQDNTGPTPNDASEGGVINFAFVAAVQLVSIDLIDIDNGAATTITLTDAGANTRTFSVPNNWTGEPGNNGAVGFDTLDFDTNNQVGFMGNIASFVDAGLFDLTMVTNIAFNFGGSAAIDNLVANVIPLPAPGLLSLAGLGLIAGVRRRAC